MPSNLLVMTLSPTVADSTAEPAASAAEAAGSYPAAGGAVAADTGPAAGAGTARAERTALAALAIAGFDSPDTRVEIVAEVAVAFEEPEFAADGGRLDAAAAGAAGVSLESAAGAGMALRTAV